MPQRHKTEEIKIDNLEPIYILIVDDNAVIGNYLRSILKKYMTPCAIDIVTSSADALKMLSQRTFDAILLDAHLETSGTAATLCTDIRTIGFTGLIILMALSEIKVQYESIIGVGADTIIYKPIEAKELVIELERHLNIQDIDRRGSITNQYPIVNHQTSPPLIKKPTSAA